MKKETKIIIVLTLIYQTLQSAFSTDFPATSTKTIGDMTLKWKKDGTKAVLHIKKTTAGFGCIGLGGNTMAQANFLFFDKTASAGTVDGVTIKDCAAKDHAMPDTCKGGTGTWTIVHSTADPTSFEIEVSRDLTDSDAATYDFADGTIQFIWAQGSTNTMESKHTAGNVGTGSLTWPMVQVSGGSFSTDFPAVNKKTFGDMTLKWKKDGTKAVLLVEKSTAGFGSIGLGKKVMAGANVLYFDKTESGGTVDGVTIRDCTSTGHTKPSTCKSGTGTWTIEHSTANPTSFKIEVSRVLTDSDSDTFDFADGSIDYIWAQGSTNTMDAKHTTGNFGFGSFTWPEHVPTFSNDFASTDKKTAGDMTLKWKKDGDKIVFLVEKTTAGFGSIGLGKKVMAGANILFFDKTKSGDTVDGVTVRDCTSTGHSKPSNCKSGTGSWTIVESTANPTTFKIEISRTLTDSDADTYDFADGDIDYIWAQGSTDTMTAKHTTGNFGAGTFAFNKADGNGNIENRPSYSGLFGSSLILVILSCLLK